HQQIETKKRNMRAVRTNERTWTTLFIYSEDEQAILKKWGDNKLKNLDYNAPGMG
ncbi:hypothetical protein WA026_006151, partial [Henosepilachna vigintioctopunctata]